MTTKPVSAIIPAAGNSGRMGSDKALLPFSDGLSFAGHLINSYSGFGAHPIVLVVNKNLDLSKMDQGQYDLLLNEYPDLGRSYSILLGTRNVPKDCPCFLHNIDNPFIESELLEGLMDGVVPDGFAVPVCSGRGGHPILLGEQVINYLQNLNELPDFRTVLKQFRKIEIPCNDQRILLNINTDEDYRMFLKLQSGKTNHLYKY